MQLHEAVPALFFYFFWHRIGQFVGGRTFYRAELEATNTIQTRFFQEVEQHLEVFFGFAWEAHNEGGTQRQIRADLTPLLNALQLAINTAWTLHQFQNAWAGMLQWDIQIWQDLAFRHQWNHIIHVRIRVNVVQTCPDAEFSQLFTQANHAGFHRLTIVETGAVLNVHAIS
ncbi:hypothetical protein D3C75_696700 [compost metagenome]